MTRGRGLFVAAVVAATAVAFAVRAPRLTQRPMHPDEANQAVKAADLRRSGTIRYDREDHHGPSLYWLSLPCFWLTGVDRPADSDESPYRIVPVVFGAALVLLMLPAVDGLGRAAVLAAAGLMIVSPAMVFYSRYYIQETLLVVFTWMTVVSGWRYLRRPSFGWALAAGASVGLMHATKETWVLAAAAMAAAAILAALWGRRRDRRIAASSDFAPCATAACSAPCCVYVRTAHAVSAAAAAIVVAVAFYSSFGVDWEGPVHSITAYSVYWQRGTKPQLHAQPWYFYLERLFAFRPAPGVFWSEGVLAVLAIVGGVAVLAARATPNRSLALQRFLVFYTPILLVLYSAIRYKTPWCMLSFLHGLILLAGLGTVALLTHAPRWWAKAAVAALWIAGTGHLGWQCYRLNFDLPNDPRNPYVYAHTSGNVLKMAARMDELAAVSPEGYRLTIHVVTPQNFWPLPWYLRRFDADRMGYWPDAKRWADDLATTPPPAVIVTTADVQDTVDAHLPAAYNQQMMYRLRPELFLTVYVRQDLWDAFLAAGASESAAEPSR